LRAPAVQLNLPVTGAVETNLIGRKVGDVARSGGRLDFKTEAWKVRTFEIE
jgi:hypothetical protein